MVIATMFTDPTSTVRTRAPAGRQALSAAHYCSSGLSRHLPLVPGRRAREFKNITNEPTNLLKTLTFHFWNSAEPTKLLKTLRICLLSNHLAETNGDISSASLEIAGRFGRGAGAEPEKATAEIGARKNEKCYERTRQLIENIDIPFFEFVGSRQHIENKHDIVIMPSGYWKHEGYRQQSGSNLLALRGKWHNDRVVRTSRPAWCA